MSEGYGPECNLGGGHRGRLEQNCGELYRLAEGFCIGCVGGWGANEVG